jgi:hypothetical protein
VAPGTVAAEALRRGFNVFLIYRAATLAGAGGLSWLAVAANVDANPAGQALSLS